MGSAGQSRPIFFDGGQRGGLTVLGRAPSHPSHPPLPAHHTPPPGLAIPGALDPATLLLRCPARYIIVVEKDAVFQRLVEGPPLRTPFFPLPPPATAPEKFWRVLPCVLITGRGFPGARLRPPNASPLHPPPGRAQPPPVRSPQTSAPACWCGC